MAAQREAKRRRGGERGFIARLRGYVSNQIFESQSFIIIVRQRNWQRQQTSAMSRQEATQDCKKVFSRCQVLALIIMYLLAGGKGGEQGIHINI